MNPVNAASAISEAFRIYGRHASVVVGTSILLQVLGVVGTFLLIGRFGEVGFLFSGLMASIVGCMTMGVATLLLLHLRAGSDIPTIVGLVTAALPRLFPLIVLGVVVNIGLAIGFLLLVVPGVILALRWTVAAPALVAGRLGVFDAMRSSWHLTGDHLGSTSVLLAFQGGVAFGLPFLAARMAGDAPVMENLILAQACASALILPVAALASADFFLRLSGYAPIAGTGVAAASAIEVERARSDGAHSQPWVPQAATGPRPHPVAAAPQASQSATQQDPYVPSGGAPQGAYPPMPYVGGGHPAPHGAYVPPMPYARSGQPAPHGAYVPPTPSAGGGQPAPQAHGLQSPYGQPPRLPHAPQSGGHMPRAQPGQPGQPGAAPGQASPFRAAPAAQSHPSPYAHQQPAEQPQPRRHEHGAYPQPPQAYAQPQVPNAYTPQQLPSPVPQRAPAREGGSVPPPSPNK